MVRDPPEDTPPPLVPSGGASGVYQVSEVFWGVLGVSQGGSWRAQGGLRGTQGGSGVLCGRGEILGRGQGG